ncbi:hypothetical protein BDN72DRAFT_964042 [Pluteus cervinus]|uniref:Uncharacterized protein n=1 Tax=Pluteus cervinus TaxID=181527 RepID=A0ACD3ABX6_9AGAR|nr:hypothetical protein BDN72DRAFT_964042 [Pluteus cervinus]
MKATIVSLSLSLLAAAYPVTDRSVEFHTPGRSLSASRRYILQSRYDSPPACAALSQASYTAVATSAASVETYASYDGSSTYAAAAASSSSSSYDGSSDTYAAAAASSSSDYSSYRRKRIAQSDLPSLAQEWQDLCLASGGDTSTNDPCVQLAGVQGINALLVDADPCDQQNVADAMIDFANSPGVTNQAALMAYAVKYMQHPRNAVEVMGVIPSSMYCQSPPANSELNGLYNAQLEGCDPGLYGSPYTPMVPFGSEGTCPYGYTADMSSCSCSMDSSMVSANSTVIDSSMDSMGDDCSSCDSSDASSVSDCSSCDSSDVDSSNATISSSSCDSCDASSASSNSTVMSCDSCDSSVSSNSTASSDDSCDSCDSSDVSQDSSDSTDDGSDDSAYPPADTSDDSDSSDSSDSTDDSDDAPADTSDDTDDSTGDDGDDGSDDSADDSADPSDDSTDDSDDSPDTSSDVNDISGNINDPAGRK